VRVRAVVGSGELPTGTLVADLIELTKPRITVMVVVTAGIGMLLAANGGLPLELIVHTLVGTALLSAGSSALNQVLERDLDALMERTADRPLPAGRMSADTGLLFGVGLAIVGLLELAVGVNLLTALLGAVALAGYVFVYTPLKRFSSLATLVGAVPGAVPPLMGWAAVDNGIGAGGWVLFGILFLWQLPHFLAIAWLCREDYARAGFPMLPVIEPNGRSTARQMILYGAALLPVSLLPTILGLTGLTYFLGTLSLGCFFLGFCVAFSLSFSRQAARRVLLISVLYLPAVLIVMVLDRVA